jgi:hypothetical protein
MASELALALEKQFDLLPCVVAILESIDASDTADLNKAVRTRTQEREGQREGLGKCLGGLGSAWEGLGRLTVFRSQRFRAKLTSVVV